MRDDLKGATQIRRLIYIAEHTPSPVSLSTFTLALSLLLSSPTPAANLVSEAVTAASTLHPSFPSPPLPPLSLLPSLEHAHSALLRSLDASLASAKRDGERSLIFAALVQYAEALWKYGDYGGALTRYMESREWAGPRDEVVRVCMGVIKCSILTGSLSHVKSQVQRIRTIVQGDAASAAGDGAQAGGAKEDSATAALNAQLDACLGLSALKTGAFRNAAQSFLAVTSALNLPDIVSLRDCLVYGTVCALAVFSRAELRASLLQRGEWRKNVDAHCPVWRAVVSAYIDSDYHSTFRLLTQLSPAILLHPALSPHLHRLLKDIRAKAACQFFAPYTALQLSVMADGMGLSEAELEALIAELIGEGKLNGRLDMQRGLVVKKAAESRRRMYDKAQRVAERVLRDGKALLLRMSLIEADIAVQAPKKSDKQDGAKGGGG